MHLVMEHLPCSYDLTGGTHPGLTSKYVQYLEICHALVSSQVVHLLALQQKEHVNSLMSCEYVSRFNLAGCLQHPVPFCILS